MLVRKCDVGPSLYTVSRHRCSAEGRGAPARLDDGSAVHGLTGI